MQIIRKGAEADIYRTNNTVVKERAPKSYRIKELDLRLRKLRTRAEAKLLQRAAGIINAPKVLKQGEFSIEMEFINGPRVKDILSAKNFKKICRDIAQSIAALHKAEIIHGDLTTSNMLFKGGKIYFIDFGLGFFSKMPEHMAVDLHTLFETFQSTHPEIADEATALVLSEYEERHRGNSGTRWNDDKKAGGKDKVLERLERLKSRGRYIKRQALP